jgi:hypothetical protein
MANRGAVATCVAVTLGALGALAGCGGGGPSAATVKARWEKAAVAGDVDALWDLIDPQAQKAMLAAVERTAKAGEAPQRALLTVLDPRRALVTADYARTTLATDGRGVAYSLLNHSVLGCYTRTAPVTLDAAAIGSRGGRAFVKARLGGFYQDDALLAGVVVLPGCDTPAIADEPTATAEYDYQDQLGEAGKTDTRLRADHDSTAAMIGSHVAGLAAGDRRAYAQALGDLMAFYEQYGFEQEDSELPKFHVDRTGAVTVALPRFEPDQLRVVDRPQPIATWNFAP